MWAAQLDIAKLLLLGVLFKVANGGKVRYWGSSILPPIPKSAANATAIASGSNHMLALKDGYVISWGSNSHGQLDVPSSIQGHVKQIACASDRSLALLDNATVVCWGDCAAIPNAIQGQAVSIKAMPGSSAAKLRDGTWFVWDEDYSTSLNWVFDASLNATDVIEDSIPQQKYLLLPNGTLLLATSAGSVLGSSVWRYTHYGDNVIAACNSWPLGISLSRNGTLYSIISTGSGLVLAHSPLQGDFTAPLLCGGDGIFVNIFNGSIATWPQSTWPQNMSVISFDVPVRMVSVGDAHNAVLLSNGTIILSGELQNPDPLPLAIRTGIVKDISAGNLVAGAILQNGSLVGWGSLDVFDNRNFTAVSAGYNHILGLTDTGKVLQYGLENAPVPAQLASGVTAVSAGGLFSMVLINGVISVWADPSLPFSEACSAANPPPMIQGHVAQISAGSNMAIALLVNSSVAVWGCTFEGEDSIPSAATKDVIGISAGSKEAANDGSELTAVLRNGSLVYWGVQMTGLWQSPTSAIVAAEQNATNAYEIISLLANGTVVSLDTSSSNVSMLTGLESNIVRMAVGDTFVMGIEDVSAFLPPSPPAPPPAPPSPASPPPAGPKPPAPVTNQPARPVSPNPLTPPPPPLPFAALGANLGGTVTFPTAAVVGAVVGGAGLVLLSVGILLRKQYVRKNKEKTKRFTHGKEGLGGPSAADVDGVIRVRVDDGDGLAKAMDIPGIMKGDVFTRATAHAYSWVDGGVTANEVGRIEAGVNDYQLDKSATNGIVPPAVELSMQQVKEQIFLLQDGLLGRGATALVFKCLWPSRFGRDCALAIKVLTDGYDFSHETHLQSFSYEASVLSSLYPPHPNVVRLYGYCMEPPTVCLILELLPSSLKSLLRNEPAAQNVSPLSPRVQVARHKLVTLPSPNNHGTQYVTSSSETSTSTAVSSISNTVSSYGSGTHHLQTITPIVISPGAGTATDNATSKMTSEVAATDAAATTQLNMYQVCSISLDIAAGLKYLHSKPIAAQAAAIEANEHLSLVPVKEDGGAAAATSKTSQIVHRDLKPANILMNSQGTAKISDFGLARPHDRDTLMTDHIGAGTLPYMPPELLMGARVGVAAAVGATNRVDIYSKVVRGSAYHPQTQGLVERNNQAIERTSSAYTRTDHDTWDQQARLFPLFSARNQILSFLPRLGLHAVKEKTAGAEC